MGSIADRVETVREKIRLAAHNAGRDPESVQIVAVAKNAGVEAIREAVAAGIAAIGENRVQEARRKHAVLGSEVEGRRVSWHLVGHLQTNKAGHALEMFDLIHSLDSWRLASELERLAERKGRTVECLLEVNVSRDPARFGVAPEEAVGLARQVVALSRVRLAGVMAIAPVVDASEQARPFFQLARSVLNELVAEGLLRPGRAHLSMGMTQDFEVAVEEGATMVRIGSAIFGPQLERGAVP